MGFSSFFWNGRLNEQQERKRKKMLDEEFYFILFFFLLIFFFFSSCFIFVLRPFMAFLFSVFFGIFLQSRFFRSIRLRIWRFDVGEVPTMFFSWVFWFLVLERIGEEGKEHVFV